MEDSGTVHGTRVVSHRLLVKALPLTCAIVLLGTVGAAQTAAAEAPSLGSVLLETVGPHYVVEHPGEFNGATNFVDPTDPFSLFSPLAELLQDENGTAFCSGLPPRPSERRPSRHPCDPPRDVCRRRLVSCTRFGTALRRRAPCSRSPRLRGLPGCAPSRYYGYENGNTSAVERNVAEKHRYLAVFGKGDTAYFVGGGSNTSGVTEGDVVAVAQRQAAAAPGALSSRRRKAASTSSSWCSRACSLSSSAVRSCSPGAASDAGSTEHHAERRVAVSLAPATKCGSTRRCEDHRAAFGLERTAISLPSGRSSASRHEQRLTPRATLLSRQLKAGPIGQCRSGCSS